MEVLIDKETEWKAQRCGCLTASRAVDVCKRGAKGNKLQGYSDYLNELLAERLTGEMVEIKTTPSMQWGIDHEDEAAQAYEIKTGRIVTGDGKTFIKHPTVNGLGASPDRFVGDEGIVEIKCPNCCTHLDRLISNEIPEMYKWQIKVQLLCTGRKWCDFVDYDPRFRAKNLELLVIHYEPTQEELEETLNRCKEFLRDLDEQMNKINELVTNRQKGEII